MKTIFLTGSKGFVGSHLLPVLQENYIVHCGGYNEVPQVHFDYIVHLAGTTTTTDTFLPELYDNNIVYAHKIMSIPTRIIYATSTSACELSNPYAYTKRYIEYLGAACNATGLRFFNIFGPKNNKGIVKKALECAKSGEKLLLQGGYQTRDFIYIDDVMKAIVGALDSTKKIIEVGTGHGITINEAIKIIEYVSGSNIHVVKMPYSKTDMMHSVADVGIKGCLSFEEGIKLMLKS